MVEKKSEMKRGSATPVISPCRQVHLQGLTAVGEDVERHLCSLPLQVSDELLQGGGPVNLQPNGGGVSPVLQHVDEVDGVLYDESHDGEEGKEEHVEHVEPLS